MTIVCKKTDGIIFQAEKLFLEQKLFYEGEQVRNKFRALNAFMNYTYKHPKSRWILQTIYAQTVITHIQITPVMRYKLSGT
jgi:hypothetical protein